MKKNNKLINQFTCMNKIINRYNLNQFKQLKAKNKQIRYKFYKNQRLSMRNSFKL